MVPTIMTVRSAVRLRFIRMMYVIKARRAAQQLFCGYCARELLSAADARRSYCSDGCADRDWACKSTALMLFSI